MRYLKASFLIGLATTVVVMLLYASGWISNTPDLVLRNLYKMQNPTLVPMGVQIALIVLLAFGFAWTTVDITRRALKVVVAVAAMLLFITASLVLALYNVLLSPLPAVFAILISFLIGLAYGRSGSGARKRIIERLFAQRVGRNVFQQLVNSDIPADFPGQLLEGTVVVCEVQNHAELMEMLSPSDYASMTNLYLQTASDFLVEVGGFLDECTGESLRVVFGAPIPDEKHAAKASRAALDLASRLDLLNKECDATWQRRFDFRIGVNSGEMIGAAYGGTRLASFSVAGPSVEFARRLCAACATYGCRILVGPETFELASDTFEARPIEVLKGIGGRRRVELYEILSTKNGLSPERERSRDHFWRGVLYYRDGKHDKALDEFTQARITGLPDTALDYYVSRVEKARRGTKDEDQTVLLFGPGSSH